MNLPKYIVYGDENNAPSFSSSIIIESLNKAAKNLGLYDENGLSVCYSCVGYQHNRDADCIICCYELPIPQIILENLSGKPVLGVSKDNLYFLLDGGVKKELASYFILGIDTEIWAPVERKKGQDDKFVILTYTESLTRSGILELFWAIAKMEKKDRNEILLYIKDRNATPIFEKNIKELAQGNDVNLFYNNCHISNVEEERGIYAQADCHFYLNRSSTFSMTTIQSMACGVPTVSLKYSGPNEYLSDQFSGLAVEYDLVPINLENQILQNFGMRSFFFPCRDTDYWARPRINSVQNCILKLKSNAALRKRLSIYGRKIAETMTWESSALQLAYRLFEFKQKGLIK